MASYVAPPSYPSYASANTALPTNFSYHRPPLMKPAPPSLPLPPSSSSSSSLSMQSGIHTTAPSAVKKYCESCDKEFPNTEALNAHLKCHEQCEFPDCPFSGTKKAVATHFASKHGAYSGTGFKTIDVEGQNFRVLMGTDPEEVSVWRAERRKHFPTADHAAKKMEAAQELAKSGGIEVDLKGKKQKKVVTSTDTMDNDDSKNVAVEAEEDGSIPKSSSRSSKGTTKRVCKYFLKNRCKLEANCRFSHDIQDKKDAGTNKSPKSKNMIGSSSSTSAATERVSQKGGGVKIKQTESLLVKLLQTEIIGEENTLLQCLRYIVESNYLVDG